MNVEHRRLVCIEAKTFDVRRWGTMWHGRAEKVAEEGRHSQRGSGWTGSIMLLAWMDNVPSHLDTKPVIWLASVEHVLMTRCSGGTEHVNKYGEREAMEGVH